MKLYDLCVVIQDSEIELNREYAIIIEDFYPNYYMVELWTFESNNEVKMKSLPPKILRLATEEEKKEYQLKFKVYCDENNNSV